MANFEVTVKNRPGPPARGWTVVSRIPWRWLGILAVVLAALVPLGSGRLPVSTDGTNHLFRMVELNAAIQAGVLWPRYSPDLVYGYGYPLFNYYALPLYYLGVGLHWLGLDYVPALLVLLGGSIVVGALGVFKATETFFGPGAGYVAAAVYAFAPYTLMNVLARSSVAEAVAVAWLPWLLWSLNRAFARPGAWPAVRLSLLYAALLYMHNVTAMIGTSVLAIFMGFEFAGVIRQAGLRGGLARGGLAAGALALGLLVAAYFWLPALLETRYVQIDHMIVDYQSGFLTWSQMLPSPMPFDPRLAPTPVNMALGWPAAGLALVGGLAFFRQPGRALRVRVLGLMVILVGLVAMALSTSRPLWDHLPLLQLFQFPWRFVGPACVVAALLAGSAFGLAVQSGKWRALPVAALLITTMYGLTWTWCKYGEAIVQPTRADIHTYEITTNLIGTTVHREYLPAGVSELPPKDRLAAQYAAGGAIERLDHESLPAWVTVISSTSAALSAQATFTTAQPFAATFLWFYFPGWQARIDGKPAALRASTPYGLIEVGVPAGKHTVRVYFGSTPLRQVAGGLSVLGLLGLVAAGFALPRLGGWKSLTPTTEPNVRPETHRRALLITLAAVGFGIAGLRLYLDGRDSPFRYTRYDGQRVAGAGLDLDLNFGDEINLIGVDRPVTTAADQPIPIVLYWRSYGKPSRNYSTSVRLVDEAGHLFGQQDVYQPAGLPTSIWSPESYTSDAHPLQPYSGTPPGVYRVVVVAYPEAGSGPALPVYDANHLSSGGSVEVAQVTLTAPGRVPADAALNVQHASSARLGPLTLIGYDLSATSLAPGDDLALTLYWRVVARPAGEVIARLRLVTAGGKIVSLAEFSPVRDDFAPSAWAIGAGLRAPHEFVVPPTVEGGTAELRLELEDTAGQPLGEEVALSTLEVVAPQRSFASPSIQTPGDWRLGDGIRFLGYDLPATSLRAGDPLFITLYWQAVTILPRRYVVFVHLLNTEGQVVAQVDTAPLHGTRPTSGWLPGEVLTDEYTLALPPDVPGGNYGLEIGMYAAKTLQRLPVTDSANRALGDLIHLGTIVVGP